VRGEITGTESILIEGRVEGSVNIPGERVTVGPNGRVIASMTASMNVCITAREIIVLGNVTGNVSADRVEIRIEGSLTGDISTARISIADGALFRGGIDIRESNGKPANSASSHGPSASA
jgi:cytoskeletal protein CcmA (bactofilin family)